MAIVIEEERRPVNWFALAIIAIVLLVVFFGSYFLFFKKPELIEVVVPTELKEVSRISQLSFDPEGIMSSPAFQSFRKYTDAVPRTQTPGRDNPFAFPQSQ